MPGMPAMPPTTMTQTDAMTCDGRWLHSTSKGNFMGMPYEGHGLLGFDPTTDEFVSIWVDNFAPKIGILRGTQDANTKIITYRGETIGPAGQPVDTTNTARFQDADHWTMETKSVTKDGKAAGTMKMQYTRNR